jgi:hypothetical protein
MKVWSEIHLYMFNATLCQLKVKNREFEERVMTLSSGKKINNYQVS